MSIGVSDWSSNQMKNLVPASLKTNDVVLNSRTVDFLTTLQQFEDLPERLESSDPLCQDDMLALGKAVIPFAKRKHEVHGLLYEIADCLQMLPDIKIKRFFASGEYGRKTAVGAYRCNSVVAFVNLDTYGGHTNVVKTMHDHMKRHYAIKKEATARFAGKTTSENSPDTSNKLICDVNLDRGGNMLVSLANGYPLKMRVLVADERYCPDTDHMNYTDILSTAYQNYLDHSNDPDAANLLEANIQEPSDRFYQAVPDEYLSFVRFVKYWAGMTLCDFVSPEAVEALCFKLLIRNESSGQEFDTVVIFNDLLCYLANPEAISDLDDHMHLPANAFDRPKFYKRGSSSAPLLDIDWESLSPPKEEGKIRIRSLFNPTVNLTEFVSDLEWKAIKSIVNKIKNKERPFTLGDCFAFVFEEQKVKLPTASGEMSRLLKLDTVILGFVMLGIIALIWSLESPRGNFSPEPFQMISRGLESGVNRVGQWLYEHDYNIILNTKLFSVLEDRCLILADVVRDLPSHWEHSVPSGMRHQVVMSRDYYSVYVRDSLTHFASVIMDRIR